MEGRSDVLFLKLAAKLYREERGIDVFNDFGVLAAGDGDDGGVDGVNRRLSAARQLAEYDLTPAGAKRYRFIGLFDNDEAGRRALKRACNFDPRVVRYEDVFLLHPVMPIAGGSPGSVVEKRAETLNYDFRRLDWEVEDLFSPDFLRAFVADYPNAVVHETTIGGRTHRDLSRDGKTALREFAEKYATLDDVIDLIRLICSLRDYLHLQHNHILPTQGDSG
ncbi:hypothetical protein RC1_0054 [Rhodospirillum centenum SW]|uniref:Uncharacterized protein n=1 Tax=Rhodospirillum centenum (strain ATCC 51521 / SW) TaxID=414684 RepID=B6IPW8_RHOCS|nr:hypothetical protein RC1_0054 [Rhodospirillum centenum SW]